MQRAGEFSLERHRVMEPLRPRYFTLRTVEMGRVLAEHLNGLAIMSSVFPNVSGRRIGEIVTAIERICTLKPSTETTLYVVIRKR